MTQLSVAEAARLLGVSVSRVHQRIGAGTLPAERIGRQWVVLSTDIHALRESSSGRPLSWRSAWTIVADSVTRDPGSETTISSWAAAWLDRREPTERRRARIRLDRLLDTRGTLDDETARSVAAVLRRALGNRASRRLLRAATVDLEDLRHDPRCRPAGLSHPESGLASGDVAEFYVPAGDYDGVVRDFLLEEAATTGNTIAHVVEDVLVTDTRGEIFGVPLILAADLAEHDDPRAANRSVEVLASLTRAVTS